MKKISKTLRVLCLGILFLLSVASGASAEDMEAELYEKSGSSGMYESLDPVSYTHLDVYKRQHIYKSFLNQ